MLLKVIFRVYKINKVNLIIKVDSIKSSAESSKTYCWSIHLTVELGQSQLFIN